LRTDLSQLEMLTGKLVARAVEMAGEEEARGG